MDYGGSNRYSSGCGGACDAMPVPDDPGWTLIDDADGCKQWFNPNDTIFTTGKRNPNTHYCGSPPPSDAGEDASADANDVDAGDPGDSG